VARVGDERAGPGPDTDRRVPGHEATSEPGYEATTEEFNVPGLQFLLKTPAGVLVAQRLVGNQALQRLLCPPNPVEVALRGSASSEASPYPGGHRSGEHADAGLPVAVSRDAANATAPSSDGGGQVIAGNPGDSAEPLGGGPGNVAYSYTKNSSSGGNFQFTDPDYNSLMATLTARAGREEIGRCFPNLTLMLNGIAVPQDGSTVNVPDESAPVKTGTFSVVDNITLPTWTNLSAPAVQDAQRTEWNRYATAVAAHEDLHAADDKATYDPVGATLGQKKIGAAIDAVSGATTAANALAAPRDSSNPAPTLNPAGTTQVP
jgi:hypothetical protein